MILIASAAKVAPGYLYAVRLPEKGSCILVGYRATALYLNTWLTVLYTLKFNQLTDIVVVDRPEKKFRFLLNYLFLSASFNRRIRVSVQSNEITTVPSHSPLVKGSNWLEREAWDLFGVFF